MKAKLGEADWKLTANIIAILARRGSQDEYNLALMAHTGSNVERMALWMQLSEAAREACVGPREPRTEEDVDDPAPGGAPG